MFDPAFVGKRYRGVNAHLGEGSYLQQQVSWLRFVVDSIYDAPKAMGVSVEVYAAAWMESVAWQLEDAERTGRLIEVPWPVHDNDAEGD